MAALLQSEWIVPRLKVSGKKQLLMELARRAAPITGQSERVIFDLLLQREHLGSTGVGRGVAIPHGRLTQLDRIYGIFARLERPIDFDSVDDRPVDLIFMLLAPDNEGADHLKALARVSRVLRDDTLCSKLRGCDTADAILALLNATEKPDAA